MAIMMMKGQPIDEREATVSVWDHGLLYGVGAFETIRLYRGQPFLLREHVARLNQGLARMKIRSPHTLNEWATQITELVHLNHVWEGSVRLMVTGGVEGLGLTISSYEQPISMAMVRPLSFDPVRLFQQGKRLQVLTLPRQVIGGVENFKTNNYLNSILARQEVVGFPAVEGLLLTPDGKLAEGIVSNLFFVSANTLYTPSLDLGILAGVTRQFVIQLARELGLQVEEGHYRLEQLQQADEIFLTNSLQEIIPITAINDQPIAVRRKMTQQLWEAYQLATASIHLA